MADSTTKVEMQDVLSSIRRLVSDDPDDVTVTTNVIEDRFILTPAHRVETDSGMEVPSFVPDTPQVDALAPLVPLDLSGFIRRSSETTTQTTAETDSHFAAEFHHEVPDSVDENRQQTPSLESRIAELEAAVSSTSDEWEPDGSEPEANVMPDRHIFSVVRNDVFDEADDVPVSDEDEADQIVGSESDQVDESKPLQLADVAMFTHIPRVEDMEEMSTFTPTVVPLPVIVEPTVEAKGETQRAELVNNDDDVFVDEDVLRRVVTEVVREELQGKMGERITRNVRRMVRREIEQTLSLKDFD